MGRRHDKGRRKGRRLRQQQQQQRKREALHAGDAASPGRALRTDLCFRLRGGTVWKLDFHPVLLDWDGAHPLSLNEAEAVNRLLHKESTGTVQEPN